MLKVQLRSKHVLCVQMQLYGYNVDLYRNMSEAQHSSNGIVGVSVMMKVSEGE